MDKYYDMLLRARNFDDVVELIFIINGDIDYYMEVNNLEEAKKLKEILNLIVYVSLDIIKKKFKEVLPMIREVRMNMLGSSKDKYVELYEIIGDISVLSSKLSGDDVESLNRWLLKLFKFYKDNGYVVRKEDFNNIFSSKTVNYQENNIVIKEYMSLFLELTDSEFKEEVDNSKMVELIFDMGKRGLFSVTSENPVYDTVRLAILDFNNKHKDIFDKYFKLLNEKSNVIGFGEIDIENVSSVSDLLKDNIKIINRKISELDSGDISFIMPSYNEMLATVKDIGSDIKIYNICNMITNGKYSDMSILDRDKFFKDIPQIMDIIVKCKLFNELFLKYDNYSRFNGYYQLKKDISTYRKDFRQFQKDKEELSGKKSIFGRKKLVDEMERVDRGLLIAGNQLKFLYQKRSEYIYGFNRSCDSLEFVQKYHISGMNSHDKIFGVFDFDMLPINDTNVNELEIFKKYEIKLPSLNSKEFLSLSEICLKLINSPYFKNRINNGIRICTDIDDKKLDDVNDGKFDKLVETVNLDDNDEVIFHRR